MRQFWRLSGSFAADMGHFDAGSRGHAPRRRARPARIAPAIARSAAVLYLARRYGEAVAAYTDSISLAPDFTSTYGARGLAYYGLGDLERARNSCETKREHWGSQQCLAVVYEKLGRARGCGSRDLRN